MDDGGGDGGGSFRVKHGSDAAEVTDVQFMKQERERLLMWLEKER